MDHRRAPRHEGEGVYDMTRHELKVIASPTADPANWETGPDGKTKLSYVGYHALCNLFKAEGANPLEAVALVYCVAMADEDSIYWACEGDLQAIVEHARACGKLPKKDVN